MHVSIFVYAIYIYVYIYIYIFIYIYINLYLYLPLAWYVLKMPIFIINNLRIIAINRGGYEADSSAFTVAEVESLGYISRWGGTFLVVIRASEGPQSSRIGGIKGC